MGLNEYFSTNAGYSFLMNVLLLGVTVIMFIIMWRVTRVPSKPAPVFQSTQDIMVWLSSQAEAIARDFDVTLDYTPQSIEQVEMVLGRLHEQCIQQPSSEGMPGIASAFGAYIGEVIRRNEPDARWEQDHPVLGKRSYPLHWGGGDSFPLAWCHKRLTNGPEDNVWYKYSVFKRQRIGELEEDASAPPDPDPIA